MSAAAKKERELQQLLKRLVHVVVGSEEDIAKPILGFFIEQALLEIGDNQSQRKVTLGVRQVFHLDFSPTEIGDALKVLAENGRVVATTDGRYSLETRRADELRKQNLETGAYEDKIFLDWTTALGEKYPDLTDEDKASLVGDLRLYLNSVFLTHGAECAVLIYPEEAKITALLEKSSIETFEQGLPSRGDRQSEIRLIEFPLFLKQIDNEKKVYFAKILDGTFLYSLVQVDPTTQSFVRDNFKNYKVFLDTNVIFALFDLRNPQSTTAIGQTLALAKTFGIKAVVSQSTVEEMKASIDAKREMLLMSPPIDRQLAELGADVSEEENFITAYWRAFYRTGITKEDFIEKFTHVSELLASKEIPIERTQGFSRGVVEKEVEILTNSIKPSRKNKHVAPHDAYHKLLINRLRELAETKQTPEKFWFMTLDGLMLVYDRKTRTKDAPPFVMLPDQLLQILRRFKSRTEDYDEAFFELFSRPQIKSAQGVLPNGIVQKILAKMSGFQDLPADVARSVILDQTFRKGVVTVANDDQKLTELVVEKVDSALATELRLSKEKLEVTERKQKDAEKTSTETSGVVSQQAEQIKFLRNLASYLSFALFLIVNVAVFVFAWPHLHKIFKAIFLALDIYALYGVIRIKSKVGKAWTIALGIVGAIGFILQALS